MTPHAWQVIEHYLVSIGDEFRHVVTGVELTARAENLGTGQYWVTSADSGARWTHTINVMVARDGNGIVWRVPTVDGKTALFRHTAEDALWLVAKMHAPSPLAVEIDQLAARAAEFAREVRAARDGAAEGERRFLGPLGDIGSWLAEVEHELGKAAATLERQARRPARPCPAEWGVCPEHGATIDIERSGHQVAYGCRDRDCPRTWDYDRAAQPCTEPAAYRVTDPEGGVTELCAGHVIGLRKMPNAHQWHCAPLPIES
ncbi:hypothetical protein [Nonomuraea sp. NEAU-A123]|uniref:hypothetical protein n=1 Tax=Nonomuraea sp. NEAU-A123 TaxID=2839649 RepID=UPI001BE4D42C|nr:hypothetical protein [Nonomuraea sp. NEAU-A123]MBT2226273.1 hypothetical protein [Nonomuraea sp. NEAU-A123]